MSSATFDNASYSQSPQHPQISSPGTMTTPRSHATGPSSNSYYAGQNAQQINLPIRTNTQQMSPASATSGASYDARGYARASQPQAGYGSESDRRAVPQSPREEQTPQQPGSGKSQRTRTTPTASRSATAVGQPPMGTDLPRENSAVINRIVVDDPQADIAREEMRQAEARPHPPG